MNFKQILKYILWFLIPASSCMIVLGNTIVQNHVAVPHIGMAILAGCGLINIYLQEKPGLYIDKKVLACFTGIFMVYVAAMIIHNESWYFTKFFLQNHAVIMIYPLILALIPHQSYKFYTLNFYTYNIVFAIISGIALKNYIYKVYIVESRHFTHQEVIDRRLIPFDLWHHMLSLLLVTGILFMMYIIFNNLYLKSKHEKWPLIMLIIFFIIMIHLSGSRIGILLLYLVIIYYLYRMAIKQIKAYKAIGFIAIFGLITLFAGLYLFLPKFNERIDQTTADISKLFNKEYNNTFTPLVARIFSYKVGFKIIEEHPWKGVSFGNEGDFYFNYYARNYVGVQKLRPHNQFIYITTVIGIPLAMVFTLFLLLPLWLKRKEKNNLFWLFYILHLLYMQAFYPFLTKEWFYIFSFMTPLCFHMIASKKKNYLLKPA